MSNPEIVLMRTDDIVPYENNPRKNDEAVEKVANSIREFGFKSPIIVDKDNVIICGHTRWKSAQMLGLEEVPVVIASDLTQNQVDAYRLADNKTAEFAEWDFDMLNEELEGIDWLDIDMTQFGFYLDKENDDDDNPYSSEVNGLIYEPSDMKPSIFELADIEKMTQLKNEIDKAKIPSDEKEFLKMAAMRHIVFDYSKIADYYANSDDEMRRLMEESALVIVDYGKAIENGYVKLRGDLEAVFSDER